jgi:hypothetical protein
MQIVNQQADINAYESAFIAIIMVLIQTKMSLTYKE